MSWTSQTLGEILERHARERPKAEALVTPKRRITYEDLSLRARSAAATLHTLGLRRGDHVGILMGNDEKWLALFYGAALIGAVTVPVNTRFKTAEIDFCLKQANCKALFYVPRFLNIDFEKMVRETGFSKAFDITRALPEWSIGDTTTVAPQDTLLIQFTSGNDTLFQMLMGHEDFPKRKLTLRGGWAAAGPQTMRRIIDVLGAKTVCAAYGLSEASPNVVMSDWRDAEELRVNGLAKPHDGVEVRISPEGEIQVRGWNIMQGYYNNPEANAKAFTEDGWLRTGDLGELTKDGRLRMVGRLKDVFRVGGENVAPAEVEEVLLAHPAVQTAQVIGVPDSRLGEVPAAYVTLKDGQRAEESDLIAWCKERCANFRVPRYLRIVEDFEAIGMTASGKVQKNKLRAHALRELGLSG